MGQLIHIDFGRSDEALMTKKQLSRHPAVRRSTRWIEQRVGEGMPSTMERGRRMFCLSEVRAWLESRKRGVVNG